MTIEDLLEITAHYLLAFVRITGGRLKAQNHRALSACFSDSTFFFTA
jgi:hypothetical protein